MMAITREDDSDAGFTLIELLVSFAILSVLAIFFTNGITFGARVLEKNGLAIDRAREVEAVQSVLRRQINGIYLRKRARSSQTRTIDFSGTRNEISYWSELPRAFGEGGHVEAKLSFDQSRDGTSLIISWCSGGRECFSEVLLDRLEGGEFIYIDSQTQAPLVRWEGRRELPGFIEINLVFADDDARVWPDFGATPMIDRAANCRFDPVSKRCRRL